MQVQLEKIEQLLQPLAESMACEVIACEWTQEMGRRILRIYLDKPEGVMLEDCERFSNLVNPLLDVEDLIAQSYDLEVSSPGINRPLKRLKDFERFTGQTIRVKTFTPLGGRSRYKGKLVEVKEQFIKVEVDKQEYKIPLSEIEKANLEVGVDEVLKKGKKK
ncbi:MAG: ribosome maturation factor RimP [Deltaproteobacteria bacterium]|nr:ribosome maturation factor RimP [Deltaproteobacteria bacterium]